MNGDSTSVAGVGFELADSVSPKSNKILSISPVWHMRIVPSSRVMMSTPSRYPADVVLFDSKIELTGTH